MSNRRPASTAKSIVAPSSTPLHLVDTSSREGAFRRRPVALRPVAMTTARPAVKSGAPAAPPTTIVPASAPISTGYRPQVARSLARPAVSAATAADPNRRRP